MGSVPAQRPRRLPAKGAIEAAEAFEDGFAEFVGSVGVDTDGLSMMGHQAKRLARLVKDCPI